MKRIFLIVLAVLFLTNSRLRGQEGQKQLDTAKSLELEQRFDDAMQAYERLIASNPDPEVLLKAKVSLGRIYLDVKKDTAKAQPYFEEGIKALKYPDLQAVSMLYNGKALLSQNKVQPALAEFDSVIRTYPNSDSVVEALLEGGKILELQHDYGRAKINYQSIVSQFPDSELAPQAFVRLGRSLGKLGEVSSALEAYQNVQLRYEGQKDEAVMSKDEATLLYRLFRLKSNSPTAGAPGIFTVSTVASKSNSFKLDDPSQMYYAGGKLSILDHEKSFAFAATGEPQAPDSPSADFVDFEGKPYRIGKSALVPPNGAILSVYTLKAGKKEPFGDIDAVAANQYGSLIVATRGPNGIYRVDPQTGEATSFVRGEIKAKKIGVDSEGNFYVLDSSQTGINIYDANGDQLDVITGSKLGLKELVDFGLDTFDNIYLLDSAAQFLVVGGLHQPDYKLAKIHKQDIMDQANQKEIKPMKDLRALTVLPNGTVFVVSKQYLLTFK